jgi:hypothetical protein
VSLEEVQAADEMPRQSATAEIYAAYPLTILSRNRKKEIGNRTKMKTIGLRYLRGSCSGFPRLQAQARTRDAANVHSSFKSDLHVDMNIDTGIR